MKTRRIGQYELVGLLGEGGIGQVFVARDTEVGRQAAIKTLRPEFTRDKHFIERFYAEAQSMGRLAPHPNITTLYYLHADRQEPAMAMELIRGHTLAALLGRVHRLSLRDASAVVVQTIAGLAYAHREGVIHRDIKPDNLMIDERGLIKIMDFGISRVQGSRRLTRAGQIFGTLLYAPPEQIRGAETDERSDLYSLAVVLYEMLSGAPPFMFENEYELQTAHMQMLPPPLAGRVRDLTSEMEAAIMRALSKRPEDRFVSVDEFGRALGVGTVATDAPDILKQLVGSVFRNTPSAATRMIPSGAGSEARSREAGSTGSRRVDPAVGPERNRQGILSLLGVEQAFRGPVMLLVAAVIGVGIGLGYMFFLPGPAPPPQRSVVIDAPPRTQEPPPTSEMDGKSAHRESTVMVVPRIPREGGSASPPRDTTQPAPPVLPPPTPPISVPTPIPAPPTPAPLQPTPAPFAHEVPPRGQPDLSGPFQDLTDASVFIYNGKRFQLFGVNDPSPATQQHKASVLAVVHSILDGKTMDCYRKEPLQYQCFVNGEDDLAILLLRRGLLVLRSDAPKEYTAFASR